MAKYLSQEWHDETVRLAQSFPERAGATARMQYRITSMPEGGDCWYYWVLEDGKLLEATLGQDPDAELTMQVSYADNRLVQEGELDPNAAFMQGKMKVYGEHGEADVADAPDREPRVQGDPRADPRASRSTSGHLDLPRVRRVEQRPCTSQCRPR